MRILGRLLDRITPWRRGYMAGWDDGNRSAVQDLEILLEEHDGDVIPRAEIEAVAARLRAELVHH